MPRKPRMYLPGYPCHIIQRGNNREATFFQSRITCSISPVLKMRRKGIELWVTMIGRRLRPAPNEG